MGDGMTLFWFHGDHGRQFIYARNWLEALGWLLAAPDGSLPRRLAFEVGRGGRVIVRDMDLGRMYLLVPDAAAELEPDLTDEAAIEATSDSLLPV